MAANNYASTLLDLEQYAEAKIIQRVMIPSARRVFGACDEFTLGLRWMYAKALYLDGDATLDDLREAVKTLEDIEQTARRVLGGAHPVTTRVVEELLHARELSNK